MTVECSYPHGENTAGVNDKLAFQLGLHGLKLTRCSHFDNKLIEDWLIECTGNHLILGEEQGSFIEWRFFNSVGDEGWQDAEAWLREEVPA